MPSADLIQFETPENIQVFYRPAGLGTRFIAWFIDNLFLAVVMFALFIILAISGIASEAIFRHLPQPGDPQRPDHVARGIAYAMGFFLLISGFGGFVYFIICELLMRGQTVGKRQMGLRVVKANGFSLDATSIFVRNIFRVVDNLPVLWLVPFVTQRSQRLGDLVAGTIVVVDKIEQMTSVREILSSRAPQVSKFRFDAVALKLARPEDVQAVEKILERWSSLSPNDQDLFLTRIVGPLATRLKVEMPSASDRVLFLEDFLAAAYRRQHQTLG